MMLQIAGVWLFLLVAWLVAPWYARNVLGHPGEAAPTAEIEAFEHEVLPRRVFIMRAYQVSFALLATVVVWAGG